MNLHAEIMNIQITVDRSGWLPVEKNGYAHGHRDARHVAAELSLKAEAYIEILEDHLLESIGAMLGGNLTRESDMGKSILEALKQKASSSIDEHMQQYCGERRYEMENKIN